MVEEAIPEDDFNEKRGRELANQLSAQMQELKNRLEANAPTEKTVERILSVRRQLGELIGDADESPHDRLLADATALLEKIFPKTEESVHGFSPSKRRYSDYQRESIKAQHARTPKNERW